MVKDINPNSGASSTPSELVVVGKTLYFYADDGTHGAELWKSDGHRRGTRLVRDVHPGSDGASPYFLTKFDGQLFLSLNDGARGDELWKSDGTRRGTRLVADINRGPTGSAPLRPDSGWARALFQRWRRHPRQ